MPDRATPAMEEPLPMNARNEGDGVNPNPAAEQGGATPPATPQQPTNTQAPDSPLGEPGLRALQAEREARAETERRLAEAQRKLDEAAAEKLSELEKAQQSAAAAQQAMQEAASAKELTYAENLRLRFALENGVPGAWVDRLRGNTVDELAADWQTIQPTLAPAVDPNAPRVPAPLPHAGPQGGPPQTEEDLLYEQIYGSPRK